MLKNTFLHIQGIGAVTEQRIWESGIMDWDGFREQSAVAIPAGRKRLLTAGLEESQRRLERKQPAYFSKRLPSNQSWRIFPEFRDSTVYLDIETTGLDRDLGSITTIALYDGKTLRTYVQGDNLDAFPEDIRKYKVIISYNGKCFDIPFIERFFHIRLDQAQIDLRFVFQSLGFRGGLKGIERQLGMDRGDLSDVDGFFAVLLWDEYRRNRNPKVLETLLAYNIQDTVNLESLMITAYNMAIQDTPFSSTLQMAPPATPFNPYRADRGIVDKLKATYPGSSMYY
jgi:uncharacterized protein YprB with RNaseH-like and TPR domain